MSQMDLRVESMIEKTMEMMQNDLQIHQLLIYNITRLNAGVEIMIEMMLNQGVTRVTNSERARSMIDEMVKASREVDEAKKKRSS